jgi:hypothetical protein
MCIDLSAPLTELHLCGVCILYAQHHRITGLAGFVSAIAHYGPSRRSPVMDDGSLSLTARTSTSSSTSSYASRLPLSSVCTTLVAGARSRRFRQMGSSAVSSSPFLSSFLWPFNSLFISFGGCSACSGRYCRPLARPELLSGLIAQLLSCLCHALCHACASIRARPSRVSQEQSGETL